MPSFNFILLHMEVFHLGGQVFKFINRIVSVKDRR